MKVLIIGSGGREHALVWKLSQSNEIKKIYCAPGNAGTQELAENVPIAANNIQGLIEFCKTENINLTIVGPEEPLSLGIVDSFTSCGLKVFGPTKRAAQLEASKIFAKKFMRRFGIPTADFRTFNRRTRAISYLRACSFPIVVKADGLATGKGVSICHSLSEAEEMLDKMMQERIFGDAGAKIVIEEYLQGEEASVLAFTDGKNVIPMVPAQDHKPVFDGDNGPNTGGMGCYAPVPIVTPTLLQRIIKEALIPTIQGMEKLGWPYKGVLYAGLMINKDDFKVLEFNCRFGDPETQVILPLLQSDILQVVDGCINGYLDKIQLEWTNKACVCVVLASDGYPLSYEKGKKIKGLEELVKTDKIISFHSGTIRKGQEVLTNGGRVLGITGVAQTLGQAIRETYKGVKKISFEGMHYRTDIGLKALRGEKPAA